MRCKTCDYYLWNIDRRNCPECGADFLPSDYRFKPNAVAFCCPHCHQDYYGTDEDGHLSPQEFECVQCLNPIHMNQMILRPADGYDIDNTEPLASHPWEERDPKRSTIRAWYRTARAAMNKPSWLVAMPRKQNSTWGHWQFLAWHYLFISLFGFVPLLIISLILFITKGFITQTQTAIAFAGFLLAPLLFIIYALIGLLILGATAHLLLRLLAKPQGRIGDTYRCMCYSQGALVFLAIPLCGLILGVYIGVIWFLVSSILMLKQTHKTSGLSTTLAVILLPLLWLVFVALTN